MENITIKINGAEAKTLGINAEIPAILFDNGVCVVNTTPHPVTMQNVNGELVTVPTSALLNAKPIERAVSQFFVRTEFVGTPEGEAFITALNITFAKMEMKSTLVIIGSMIAAQAYPAKVAGMCPVPGYERVAPSEKRMRCDKFTIF